MHRRQGRPPGIRPCLRRRRDGAVRSQRRAPQPPCLRRTPQSVRSGVRIRAARRTPDSLPRVGVCASYGGDSTRSSVSRPRRPPHRRCRLGVFLCSGRRLLGHRTRRRHSRHPHGLIFFPILSPLSFFFLVTVQMETILRLR
ncbi:hypothetical protein LINPERHAP1_LOCUS19574 [Linum perenne]